MGYRIRIEGLSQLHVDLIAQPRHSVKTGLPVTRVADDAVEDAKGDVVLDGSSLDLTEKDKGSSCIGLRFDDVRLQRGTQVRAAHLQLTAKAEAKKPGLIKILRRSQFLSITLQKQQTEPHQASSLSNRHHLGSACLESRRPSR